MNALEWEEELSEGCCPREGSQTFMSFTSGPTPESPTKEQQQKIISYLWQRGKASTLKCIQSFLH